MRVVFDISPLGCGHAVPLYRNGTFRYVRQIALGLASAKDVELTLSAGLDGSTVWSRFCNLDDSLAHWESDQILRNIDFPHNRIARSLARAARKVEGEKANSLMGIVKSALAKGVLKSSLVALSEQTLREAEIFHSPSFALPDLPIPSSALRRFLTVHDILPVLHPEFFDSGAGTRFGAILGSLRPTDWILCDSESTRNDLCKYLSWLDRSKTLVIPLAADPVLFYRCDDLERLAGARRRYSIPEGPYVLSVCAIEPRKNLDHVVRCFTDLVRQQKMEDLNLVLVGPAGWKNQKVFDQITNSGELRNRIILTGYVRNEDMAAIYSGALMFVYPSLYEGFGLPPLEAMQCGVPVITSNTSSLPEVVGSAGILVDPRDHEQLCSNMLKVYQSPSLRTALSEASLAQADKFSWQRCVSQTVDAYKTAMRN